MSTNGPAGETRGRPASQRQPEMVNDVVEPGRASRRRRQNRRIKAFREDLAPAEDGAATKSTHRQHQGDALAIRWKIGNPASIPVMDGPGLPLAGRTDADCDPRTDRVGDLVVGSWESVDGLLYTSNCYRLPGRAGGLPLTL